MRWLITSLHVINGFGKVKIFPILAEVTKSSPNKQIPTGACGLLTQFPLRHNWPEPHIVLSAAWCSATKLKF
jgi:hypothetical protein